MIVKGKEGKREPTKFVYGLVRPVLFNEKDFDLWKAIHKHVKESDYPIYVNSAFDVVDGRLEKNQQYSGGGFHYKFWFDSEEDKQKFIDAVLLISDEVSVYNVPWWFVALKDGYNPWDYSKLSKLGKDEILKFVKMTNERLETIKRGEKNNE